MTAAEKFDLDAYMAQCRALQAYLNQGDVWFPKDRPKVRVADMDPSWRHNAARFLERRAESLAHRYTFGLVSSGSRPTWGDVVGEVDGKPVFSATALSTFELMSDAALDAFDAEMDEITRRPLEWLRTTALYRALVAGLPDGAEREALAERARHWSTCPIRSGGEECRCEEAQQRDAGRTNADAAPEWTLS